MLEEMVAWQPPSGGSRPVPYVKGLTLMVNSNLCRQSPRRHLARQIIQSASDHTARFATDVLF
jgi:hypothetical protein